MTLTSERIAEIEKADWPHASPGYRTVDQSDLTELCALAKSALSTSRVKALEWYPTGTGHWHARGLYSSWQVGPFQGKLSYTGNGASYSKDRLFDSVDEAKAAVQADYEASILSQIIDTPTLEPAPATVTEEHGWFGLGGDARLGSCASDGCGGQPTWRLEAGGVGSNYCSGCAAKIRNAALSTPSPQAASATVAENATVAAPASPVSPSGKWVLVPREPTAEMMEAGANVYDGDMIKQARAYRAMLSVAPKPAVEAEPVAARALQNGEEVDYTSVPREVHQMLQPQSEWREHGYEVQPLYTSPPSATETRNAALEEAKAIADEVAESWGDAGSAAIETSDRIAALIDNTEGSEGANASA